MKISIIIPSFNQASYIGETLDSILSQKDLDTEILVFDGGSTDGTVDIFQNYHSSLNWVSRSDKGQTDAINQGLLQSKGDILCYLNSDDILLDDSLETVRSYFVNNPDCEILYGDAYHIWEERNVREPYPTEPWNYDLLFETCYICQPAVFWRRSIIDRFGYFDDTLNLAMDYEYWLRVGKHVDFHWLQGRFLAGSRMYDDNKTFRLKIKAHEEFLKVTMRHANRTPYRWVEVLADLRAKEQPKDVAHTKGRLHQQTKEIESICKAFALPIPSNE